MESLVDGGVVDDDVCHRGSDLWCSVESFGVFGVETAHLDHSSHVHGGPGSGGQVVGGGGLEAGVVVAVVVPIDERC